MASLKGSAVASPSFNERHFRCGLHEAERVAHSALNLIGLPGFAIGELRTLLQKTLGAVYVVAAGPAANKNLELAAQAAMKMPASAFNPATVGTVIAAIRIAWPAAVTTTTKPAAVTTTIQKP